ncbi:hypothetical protein GQ42DRAFT_158538 [Ramicandelaber brevisporus]|nr:hypothetical protein GQ42DRAFT_158538 [Ramicandelaber brevisporus]
MVLPEPVGDSSSALVLVLSADIIFDITCICARYGLNGNRTLMPPIHTVWCGLEAASCTEADSAADGVDEAAGSRGGVECAVGGVNSVDCVAAVDGVDDVDIDGNAAIVDVTNAAIIANAVDIAADIDTAFHVSVTRWFAGMNALARIGKRENGAAVVTVISAAFTSVTVAATVTASVTVTATHPTGDSQTG